MILAKINPETRWLEMSPLLNHTGQSLGVIRGMHLQMHLLSGSLLDTGGNQPAALTGYYCIEDTEVQSPVVFWEVLISLTHTLCNFCYLQSLYGLQPWTPKGSPFNGFELACCGQTEESGTKGQWSSLQHSIAWKGYTLCVGNLLPMLGNLNFVWNLF